jgi:hypothetical protein
MKFYAYSKKGSADFRYAGQRPDSRATRLQHAFGYWRGTQPKGSNPTVEDMLRGDVPVTVEVHYETE